MSRAFSRLKERFPSLPYSGFGIWLAWPYLAFDAAIWQQTPSANSGIVSLALEVSLVGFLSSCFVMAVKPRFVTSVFERRRTFPVLGAVGFVSCALLCLAGSDAARVLPSGIPFALCLISNLAAGVAVSLVMARYMQLYAPLAFKQVCLLCASNVLLAGAVYYVVVGTPRPVGLVLFCLLPLASALLAEDNPDHCIEARKGIAAASDGNLSKTLIRFVVMLAVMTFANSFIRCEAYFQLDPSRTLSYVGLSVVMRMAASLVAIPIFMSLSEQTKLSRFFYASLLVVAFAPSAAALFSLDSSIVYSTLMGVYTLFELLVWCLLAQLAARMSSDVLVIFGKCWGGLTLGGMLGGVVSTCMHSVGVNETGVLIASFCIVLVCVFFSMFIFSGRSFDELIAVCLPNEEEASDEVPDDARSSAERDSERAVCTFDQAIGLFCTEYGLSPREKDIASELLQGLRPIDAANKLYLSINTVRRHIQNIYAKVDVHTREELQMSFYRSTRYAPYWEEAAAGEDPSPDLPASV